MYLDDFILPELVKGVTHWHSLISPLVPRKPTSNFLGERLFDAASELVVKVVVALLDVVLPNRAKAIDGRSDILVNCKEIVGHTIWVSIYSKKVHIMNENKVGKIHIQPEIKCSRHKSDIQGDRRIESITSATHGNCEVRRPISGVHQVCGVWCEAFLGFQNGFIKVISLSFNATSGVTLFLTEYA